MLLSFGMFDSIPKVVFSTETVFDQGLELIVVHAWYTAVYKFIIQYMY